MIVDAAMRIIFFQSGLMAEVVDTIAQDIM